MTLDTKKLVAKLKDKGFQRNAVVFVLCFLLSSVLWLFIHLSKTYSYSATYNVTYNSLPKGKAFAEQPPTSITVVMNDVGFNVLSNSWTINQNDIDIDLSGIKLKHSGNYYTGFITCDALIKRLSVGGNTNVESVIPDTLSFIFSYTDSKKVPIRANISYKILPESDIFGNIKIMPDSVKITGTKDVISKINYINTEYKDFGACMSMVADSLKLINPYPSFMKLSNNSANISLPIFKMTEGSVSISISDTTTNGTIVKALPSTVKIVYTVPIEYYSSINASMFNAKLLDSGLDNLEKGLKVEVVKHPAFVKIRKIEPQVAECIILN